MAVYQKFLGRFAITNDSKDFTLERKDGTPWGPTAAALTTGNYYLHGYTGESTDQLLEHLQDVIRNAGAANKFTTATVTLDDSTGLVSINLGASGDIVWTDTDLRDLLGFEDTTTTGGSAYTGSDQARYLWRPSEPASMYPGTLATWWAPRSTSIAHRSEDGTTYQLKGSLIYDADIEYQNLPEADVVTGSATVWAALEKFWTDVAHEAQPMRCYPDRTANSATDYVTAVWAGSGEGLGSWQDYRERQRATWNGLWTVRVPLWKQVSG